MTTNKVTKIFKRVRRKYGLGSRPLTMVDFYAICEAEGIGVDTFDIQLSGFMFRVKGKAFIVLDNKLTPERLLFVAFHELGHYYMHTPDTVAAFTPSGKSVKEVEADLFAELAVKATANTKGEKRNA